MMAKPIVGVTAWRGEFPTYAGPQILQTLEETYAVAVIEAGMVPLIIPNGQSPNSAGEIVASVDGLILTGGNDIDPELYGKERLRVEDADATVDRFEVALVTEARSQDKPVLGICRGLQLLNVALGGTLNQDVTAPGSAHEPFTSDDDPSELEQRRHSVFLEDGVLRRIFGANEINVSTLHHQGVATLAADLIVEGRARDGLIEAARYEGSWWALAVQWHPERLETARRQPLFLALKAAIESA